MPCWDYAQFIELTCNHMSWSWLPPAYLETWSFQIKHFSDVNESQSMYPKHPAHKPHIIFGTSIAMRLLEDKENIPVGKKGSQ